MTLFSNCSVVNQFNDKWTAIAHTAGADYGMRAIFFLSCFAIRRQQFRVAPNFDAFDYLNNPTRTHYYILYNYGMVRRISYSVRPDGPVPQAQPFRW